MVVTGLLNYKTFQDLVGDFPPQYFGGRSEEEILLSLSEFYPKEQEEKFGVLGIRIRLEI